MFVSEGDSNKKYICAIYTRTSHQEEEDVSEHDTVEQQRDYCKKYIELKKDKGWKLYPTKYEDRNQSGGTLNRPAFKRLLTDAKQGKFNLIVIKNIDRLTRSLQDFYDLWKILEDYEIELASAHQEFITTTSTGRLHLDIVLRFAQYEREMASERTKDQMRYRAQKGLFHGGNIPLGYDLHPTEKGLLVTNPKEAKLVKLIFSKYSEIQSAHLVAKYLDKRGYRSKLWKTKRGKNKGGGKFTEGIVLHILRNPVYIAKTAAIKGKEAPQLYDARWKPIIKLVLFERVQRIIKKNSVSRSSISKNKYGLLLSGLVWCDSCKSQMTANYSLKKGMPYLYYKCTRVDHSDKNACRIKSVSARELEDIVVDRIKYLSAHKDIVESIVKAAMKISKNKLPVLQKEKNEIMGSLRRINNQAEPLMESLTKNKFSLVEDKLRELDDEKLVLENRLQEVENEIDREGLKVLSPELITQNLILFRDIFDKLPTEKQRDLLHLLIKKITYHEDPSKIKVAFYNLPEIEPPDTPKKGTSGSSTSSSHRFDKRQYWLPREDSNLGHSGYTLTPITRRVGLSLHPRGMAGVKSLHLGPKALAQDCPTLYTE